MRILLVEDNPLTAKGLAYLLEREKYTVDLAPNLSAAQDCLGSKTYALVLLDVSLPDGDGFSFARRLRSESPELPVIFLTAKDDESDIVKGLELGAEDYITKPFRNRELLLRIRKALHLSRTTDTELTCGKIKFNLQNNAVFVDGNTIILSPLELRLLHCLMENSNRVVTRERLLDEIWEASGSIVNDNTLTVYMKRLRSKLELPGAIITVKNLGYRLCATE